MTTTTALIQSPEATLPSTGDWQLITDMAKYLVGSGFLPDAVKTPQQAAAIMLKGRELGIPAMQSFSQIHVIKGKPTCSSELMLALIARGGVTWDWQESSDKVAGVVFHRHGFADCVGRYTIEEAKKANLLGKDSWKNYPTNMLRARAISNGARMIAPDLLAGMSYTPEEMGAEVNEDNQPLEVEATVVEDDAEAAIKRANDAHAALQRDFPGPEMEGEAQVLMDSIGIETMDGLTTDHSVEMADALTKLYRFLWTELVKQVSTVEAEVHESDPHTANARKKHIGADKVQVEDWTPKDDLGAVRDYLAHLGKQLDKAAA
jgi:hypothetical protein